MINNLPFLSFNRGWIRRFQSERHLLASCSSGPEVRQICRLLPRRSSLFCYWRRRGDLHCWAVPPRQKRKERSDPEKPRAMRMPKRRDRLAKIKWIKNCHLHIKGFLLPCRRAIWNSKRSLWYCPNTSHHSSCKPRWSSHQITSLYVA